MTRVSKSFISKVIQILRRNIVMLKAKLYSEFLEPSAGFIG